ncbi:MAG TPA: hypothetical protein VEQ84_16870 [Vicinamibacteria bacterium]|nr:hypothetical protein [Vicinamibacteria bacterium]
MKREQPPIAAPRCRYCGDTAATTLALDARDQNAWRYVDLDAGVALAPGDSTGWDLAMRRFRIRWALAVADLGRKPPPGAGDAAPVTAHLPPDREVGR